jgi:hypothetical protein
MVMSTVPGIAASRPRLPHDEAYVRFTQNFHIDPHYMNALGYDVESHASRMLLVTVLGYFQGDHLVPIPGDQQVRFKPEVRIKGNAHYLQLHKPDRSRMRKLMLYAAGQPVPEFHIRFEWL